MTRLPILSLGFRPFFLAAGLAAVLLVSAWFGVLQGSLTLHTHYDAVGGSVGWHAHEMLFGFVVAVIAGFLLTAVRNWTGVETATGARLLLLIGVWLSGRIVPFLSNALPAGWIAAVDLAFLPLLTWSLSVPLLKQRKARNLAFLPILTALFASNLLVHLQCLSITASTARIGVYLAVDLIALLVSVVGGRVIPLFSRGALPGASPREWPLVDGLAILSVILLAMLRPWSSDPLLAAALRWVSLGAALVHGIRLWGWVDARARSVPLLWVLFVGYAWMVVSFALAAVSGMPSLVSLHAMTAGCIGSMTLGMMARVSLGHTGRPLQASPSVTVAFALISLAASIRVVLPILRPGDYATILAASAALWASAFVLFTLRYAGVFFSPRVDDSS